MMEPNEFAERLAARAQQAAVEQERLDRHHRIANDLLSLPDDGREALIADAREVVTQWQAERLCSVDYVERWTIILAITPSDMAATIMSDADGWGTALRQNSPFVGVSRAKGTHPTRDALEATTLVKVQPS